MPFYNPSYKILPKPEAKMSVQKVDHILHDWSNILMLQNSNPSLMYFVNFKSLAETVQWRWLAILISVLQRNRTDRIYLDIYEEIYYRNWLTLLWRPRGATICKLENQGTSGIIQSVSKCLRTRAADGVTPVRGWRSENQKFQCPRLREDEREGGGWGGWGDGGREFTLPLHLFVLLGPSIDWMRPAHIVKCDLLYFIYWCKC